MTTNKNQFRRMCEGWRLAVGALMMLLALAALAAERNDPDPSSQNAAELRAQIDISKIQWPAAPAVPRIQMLAEFFGEKAAVVPPNKPLGKRVRWMDRLAGIPPERPTIKPAKPLINPYGVVADSQGRLYVADSEAHAIAIFDQDGNDVAWYRDGPFFRFANIVGLAIDDNNRLFVIDADLRTVTVITAEGRIEATFGSAQLSRPAGAAVDTEKRLLYVADTKRDAVAVFHADSFEFLRYLGSRPKSDASEPGTLIKPTNVAVGAQGTVYVSDTLNGRIQVFDAYGDFIGNFGGSAPHTLAHPKGIAVDCDGHIWVADGTLNRVQVFDQQGHLLAYFGQFGTLPGQFIAPAGLFIDKRNRVLVSDQGSRRVQVFRYIPDSDARMKARPPQPALMASNN